MHYLKINQIDIL